jgi:uncharacterized protein (TIGR03437 family)
VYAAAPEIVPDAAGIWGIKMVKGDWSGLVTSTPLAGDLVYIYMTGLGWPEHEATTGVPASDTPNPILFQLSCRFLPQEQWATPLFAGLAPGMLGIYQAAFRLPSEPVAGGLTGIECALSTPVMTGLFGPGFPLRGLYANGSVVITPLLDRGLR